MKLHLSVFCLTFITQAEEKFLIVNAIPIVKINLFINLI